MAAEPTRTLIFMLLKMCVLIVKQDELSDWEESWKLSGTELEPKDVTDEDDETLSAASLTTDITVVLRINDVFMPGWSNSWLISAAPLQEDEEREKNWSSCWGYRQQIRWVAQSYTQRVFVTEKIMENITMRLIIFLTVNKSHEKTNMSTY